MDSKQRLAEFLLTQGEKAEIVPLSSGSSGADIFRVGRFVYKVGTVKQALAEQKAYARFRQLGSISLHILPAWSIVSIGNESAIWKIEHLGVHNLEELILAETEIERLLVLNEEVLSLLGKVFKVSRSSLETQKRLVWQELVDALMINLEKAGLSSPATDKFLSRLQTKKDQILAVFQPSLSHNDASAVNIMVRTDWQIRFIDPRLALPYLEETQALGNLALDLAAYYVSLERNRLKLEKAKSSLNISPLLTRVDEVVQEYIQAGVFTEELFQLAKLVWYSVYAACKCSYCTAKERVWLYKLMVQKVKKQMK